MHSFGERLTSAFTDRGHLCLGIDPHPFLLDTWGLPDTAAGVREFGLRCVDAAIGVVGIVKPQVAFFERHGSKGFAALEDVMVAAREARILVIADAKRGDVGSTVAAYGAAWLTQGSPLEADAMTVSAYQGVGSLADVVALAAAGGKGLFVLAATSNPESLDTQTAVRGRGVLSGRTVAAAIVDEVHSLNNPGHPAGGATVGVTPVLGSTGVVIGATIDMADFGIDAGHLVNTPILAPGFGEQGAQLSDLSALYGPVTPNVVAAVGRSVLRRGPADVRAELIDQASILAKGASR